MSIRPTETSRIQPTSGAAATGTAPGTGLSPGTRRSLLTIIGITALLCVNAFVLSPLWILHPAEVFTDTAQAPTYFPTMRISWILLTIQVILLPALVRPGAKGTPPGRVLPLAQLGFATQAATLFYLGFFDSWLLPIAPEVLDLTDLGILGVGLNVVWVFYMVANVILAVALWRAGHSRVASVLMALGAVSTPFLGAFGHGTLSLGLALHAVSILRSGAAAEMPAPTAATTRRRLTALLATCAVLAVNGLVLGPIWLSKPGEFSDTVAVPAYGVSQAVSWVGLTLLIVLVPVVARLRADRRSLPTWTVPLVQLALVLQATAHFQQALPTTWLADVAPEVLNITNGGLFMWMMQGIQVVFLLVMVTFAVTLWWAGHSKIGAVLMMLGAIVTPVLGPIGAGVLAIGLGLVVLLARRASHHTSTQW